jgi:hypothetical protein
VGIRITFSRLVPGGRLRFSRRGFLQ